MYTTQIDNGILNIYAAEPQTYYASYPAPYQQRRYFYQGALAALFITTLVLVAFAVS